MLIRCPGCGQFRSKKDDFCGNCSRFLGETLTLEEASELKPGQRLNFFWGKGDEMTLAKVEVNKVENTRVLVRGVGLVRAGRLTELIEDQKCFWANHRQLYF